MSPSLVSIPQPCAQPWAAMSPTAAGRHCAACATEVVDFTRLSDAEILAFLARQGGRPVCALANASQLAPPPPAPIWRRWLLAGLALLGWQSATSCATKPPVAPPTQSTASTATTAAPESRNVVVRGQVLDGDAGTPVAGVRVLVGDSEFGTTTDEKGNFELTMARTWGPIASGTVALKFVGNPFDFEEQKLAVNVRTTPEALTVRMKSKADRGKVMGRIRMPEPPVAPPKS